MIDINPNFDRILITVKHEEPDRVPLLDGAIAYETMSKFLGKTVVDSDISSQVEFWTRAGYDYTALTVGMMQPGKVTADSAISKLIKKRIENQNEKDGEWNLERRSFINNEKDFDEFPWEEASKLDLGKFYEVQKYLPKGMKIVALSGKIFTLTSMLMGFENFCINLVANSKFVEKVIEKVAHIQYDALRQIINVPNVAAVWSYDDIAFGTGTMISPKALRKFFFPWYKRFGKICHDNNLLFFYHTDGKIWDVMDDLIEIGVDALHPIDPTCMDIYEVKRKVGDKICIIGNISNDLLMRGTPEEIDELTKSRIKYLAPGGGYCVGSGNSVPDWAKIENYKAMIEATFRYGYYPINL